MLSKQEIFSKIDENKNKLKSFGVDKIFIYGSYRRGDFNEDSDIDFLITLIDESYEINLLDIQTFLYTLFQKDVSVSIESYLHKSVKEYILNEVEECQ